MFYIFIQIFYLITLNSHEWPRQYSPYNINTISSKQVIGLKKTINLGIISKFNIKHYELKSSEL